jgi:hypothetical protein
MTINFLEIKLARMVVKGRFLQYLGSKEHQTEDDLRDECIICMGSSDDQQAVLLACGHFFCIVSDETSLPFSWVGDGPCCLTLYSRASASCVARVKDASVLPAVRSVSARLFETVHG